MTGPLFDHPPTPRWVKGQLVYPAATPSPAVPVAPPSPLASDPSEKQAGGDPSVCRNRFPCATCKAPAGEWCRHLPTDPPSILAHWGRS